MAAGVTDVVDTALPVLHAYVPPPPAVSVVLAPAQIVALFIVAVGNGFTVTTPVVVAVQPAAEVPVTV